MAEWRPGNLWLVVLATALALAAGCGAAQPGAAGDEPAEFVLANRLGGEVLFVGEVVERRDELTALRYADGTVEWVETDRTQPLSALVGQVAGLRWPEADSEIPVEVTEIRADLVRVSLPAGGHTWVPAAMIANVIEPPEAPQEVTEVAGSGEAEAAVAPPAAPAPPASVPSKAPPPTQPEPVDVAAIRPNAIVQLFGFLQRDVAEVQERGEDQLRVRWMSTGTEAWVSPGDVVRVFDAPADRQIAAGLRVWYVGVNGLRIGTVARRRGEFVRVEPTGRSGPGEWVERGQVLEVAEPVDLDRLTPGTHVAVMMNGQVRGAVVVNRVEEEVQVYWDDSGQVEQVPASDVVSIWPT